MPLIAEYLVTTRVHVWFGHCWAESSTQTSRRIARLTGTKHTMAGNLQSGMDAAATSYPIVHPIPTYLCSLDIPSIQKNDMWDNRCRAMPSPPPLHLPPDCVLLPPADNQAAQRAQAALLELARNSGNSCLLREIALRAVGRGKIRINSLLHR